MEIEVKETSVEPAEDGTFSSFETESATLSVDDVEADKIQDKEHELNLPTARVLPEVTPFELTFRHYNKLWHQAQTDIEDILRTDLPHMPPPVYEIRLVALQRTCALFLQYVTVCNKLIDCHDHLPHPQKRRFIRKVINACIGRVLELKHEIVNLEKSDFQYLDQMLMNLSLHHPKDVEVKFPDYFREPESEEGGKNKDIVQLHLERKMEEKVATGAVSGQEKMVRMGMVFIRMIQAHERARQAREVFAEIQKKNIKKELVSRKELRKSMLYRHTRNEYATIIQRAWRKFLFGKRMEDERIREMARLETRVLFDPSEFLQEIEKDRRIIIARNLEECLKTKEELRNRMREFDVPTMKEKLEDKIRSFVDAYFTMFGDYPEFPEEVEGGSNALFFSPIPEKYVYVFPDKKGKDGKDKKDDKGKDGKKKKEEPPVYPMKVSKFTPSLMYLIYEYQQTWMGRELKNYDRYDAEMMKAEVTSEIQEEVRHMVDDKMREELTRLIEGKMRDSKKKKKGRKKDKKGKKGKGKKEIDLTPDRTLDSLVQELVDNGIIVDYPKVSLRDFIGGYNFSGSLKQLAGDKDLDPDPCLADIRRVISEYCILPMSSRVAHSAGVYVKSLLLAGPQGSGKKTLAYAVCTEIGATMIDLSAENLQGKYPDAAGLKMLSHLVLKVGRLVQPTVIFIKEAESYYWKKKPKDCRLLQPNRLKKELPKMLKKLTEEDRIMVFGVSDVPFDADPKGIAGCYEKVFVVLKPDYDCRVALWREFVTQNNDGECPESLDLSVLSNVSDGFTAGSIQRAVQKALTDRRSGWRKKVPLSAFDFVFALAEGVPVYEEEQAEYKAWLNKMPIKKHRHALLEMEDEMKVEEEEVSEPDDY